MDNAANTTEICVVFFMARIIANFPRRNANPSDSGLDRDLVQHGREPKRLWRRHWRCRQILRQKDEESFNGLKRTS